MTLGCSELIRLARAQTAGTAAGAVAALLVPAVASTAVDRILAGVSAGPVLAVLVTLLAVWTLAEVCGGRCRVAAPNRVRAALRYRLLRHVFTLGVPGTRRHATGDLVPG